MTWEYWKDHRRTPIYREQRGESSDGRTYWRYSAKLTVKRNGEEMLYFLTADTQQSIRCQIGRVLNGLTPTDCKVCTYYVPENEIRNAYCLKSSDPRCKQVIECRRGVVCPYFVVSV